MNKREFLKILSYSGAGIATMGFSSAFSSLSAKSIFSELTFADKPLFFKISLAQWSLHRTIFSGKLDHMDFASTAKKEFDIDAVEYVNQFFKDKAQDKAYLAEMKQRADDSGVKSLLIMIDDEGDLASVEENKRLKAVENHYKWVEAANYLGCHSIRVNAAGYGSKSEVGEAAIDGLGRLATFAEDYNINVIVENHGGYSSDGKWLSGVIKNVKKANCGTLPDFGNFCIEKSDPSDYSSPCSIEYDRYTGVSELMSFAKGVSAKSHDFNDLGDEVNSDYRRMLQIVKDAKYTGYIGIEYEGSKLSEMDGILATKILLLKIGKEIS